MKDLRLCLYGIALSTSGYIGTIRSPPQPKQCGCFATLKGLGDIGTYLNHSPASPGRRLGESGLQTNLSELECPDFSKSILPALVFRLGFTTMHCAFSPIQDVSVVESGYLVSFWIREFGFDHLLSPCLASFSDVPSVQAIFHCT
jgi:hypothetical protein